MDDAALQARIAELGPWHLDVAVNDRVRTSAFLDGEGPTAERDSERDPSRVSFVTPERGFRTLLERLYPGGLEGRRFLDCACNCGGYSFWAREAGAAETFGFDVRDHWIDQARFLAEHRAWPSEGMRFERMDLYDLPEAGLEPFDMTLFKGIFYHLPDPIRGLKLAADLTSDVLLLDTATAPDQPDGMLVLAEESPVAAMSGVYGLNWLPTGPQVLERTLRWLGFAETRVSVWKAASRIHDQSQVSRQRSKPHRGRIRILAAREQGRLEAIQSVSEPS